MKNKTILFGVLDAVLTLAYIVLVAWFMNYITSVQFFMMLSEVVAISIMLSVLVFSVALVGSLIFGRPILWYLDGRKREAIYLLAWTLGTFFVIFTLIIFSLISTDIALGAI